MEQLRGLIEEKVRIKVRPYGSSYEQLVVDISGGRGALKVVGWKRHGQYTPDINS